MFCGDVGTTQVNKTKTDGLGTQAGFILLWSTTYKKNIMQ